MDPTATALKPPAVSFLRHIRLVPLFSAILGGILLLFALSSGLVERLPTRISRWRRGCGQQPPTA